MRAGSNFSRAGMLSMTTSAQVGKIINNEEVSIVHVGQAKRERPDA